MHKMTIRKEMVVALLMLFLLTACGQKGDLYLPEGSNFVEGIV